jgi:hypothetical protein
MKMMKKYLRLESWGSWLPAEKNLKEKLLEALEELHNGGSPMSTNIAER